MGTGWVWAPWADLVHADDGSPYYMLQGVDETGNLYDQNGLPVNDPRSVARPAG